MLLFEIHLILHRRSRFIKKKFGDHKDQKYLLKQNLKNFHT